MTDNIARIEAAWQDFQDALADIPEARMSEPGVAGKWSVKDLLAHIAFWHEHMVHVASTRAAGGEAPHPDVEKLNLQAAVERAGWTLQHARDEALRTYQLALETARSIPDIDPELLEGDTWEHYEEHATDIRAWRGVSD